MQAFLSYKSKISVAKYRNFEYPESILNWFNNEKDTKTLFLTDPSKIGKTEGIIALLEKYNPIRINNINALKNLTSEHKAIIFDDLNWKNMDHLLEKARSSDIRIIYNVVNLPSDLIKAVIQMI